MDRRCYREDDVYCPHPLDAFLLMTGRQAAQAGSQGRQADRQADRQTDRQTDTDR